METNTIVKKPPRIFYGWWIVLSAALSSTISASVLLYGFGPFFDSLVSEFKCTRTAISWAVSLSRLQSGIMGPIDGFLVDRFGPRKIALAGRLLMGAGLMVLSRVSSLTQFYMVYMLMVTLGGGLGFFNATYTAVGNWFVRKRGAAFGLMETGLGLGGMLVPLISRLVTDNGWRQAWLIIGVAVMVAGPPLALLLRHKPEQYGYMPDGMMAPAKEVTKSGKKSDEETDFTLREALKTRAFWFLAVVFTLRIMVTSAVPIHIMPFLVDTGFERGVAATALGSIGVISAIGRLGFGWLSDILDKKYVIVGLLALLTASLILLSYLGSLWQLIVFILLYAPTYGGSAVVTQAIRGQYFGRKNFGTIMGFMQSIMMVGAVAGPVFAGYTWDITGSYRRAFIIFASAAAIATVLALVIKPPVKEESSQVRYGS